MFVFWCALFFSFSLYGGDSLFIVSGVVDPILANEQDQRVEESGVFSQNESVGEELDRFSVSSGESSDDNMQNIESISDDMGDDDFFESMDLSNLESIGCVHKLGESTSTVATQTTIPLPPDPTIGEITVALALYRQNVLLTRAQTKGRSIEILMLRVTEPKKY